MEFWTHYIETGHIHGFWDEKGSPLEGGGGEKKSNRDLDDTSSIHKTHIIQTGCDL